MQQKTPEKLFGTGEGSLPHPTQTTEGLGFLRNLSLALPPLRGARVVFDSWQFIAKTDDTKVVRFRNGTGEGSRTLNPVRERDFESRAYAIPPLRRVRTYSTVQTLACQYIWSSG